MELAYRTKASAKRSDHPEWATKMVEPESAKLTDPMNAVFKDGTVRPIPQITVASWRNAQPAGGAGGSGSAPRADDAATKPKAKAKAKSGNTKREMFTGQDTSGNNVWVDLRTDKPRGKPVDRLCLVKWDGGITPQLVQVNVKVFEAADCQEESQMEDQAVDWCTDLAKRFCAGEIDKVKMGNLKKDLLQVKADAPWVAKMRRPAAAAPAQSDPPASSLKRRPAGATPDAEPTPKSPKVATPPRTPTKRGSAASSTHVPIPPPPIGSDSD
eukprot:5738366-Pyramimonas_sp.AAC.1